VSEQQIDHRAYFTGRGFVISDNGETIYRDVVMPGFHEAAQFLLCTYSHKAPLDRRWTALAMATRPSGDTIQERVVAFDDNQTDPIAAFALAELRGWRRVGGGDAQ
jgi:hypothetical protein